MHSFLTECWLPKANLSSTALKPSGSISGMDENPFLSPSRMRQTLISAELKQDSFQCRSTESCCCRCASRINQNLSREYQDVILSHCSAICLSPSSFDYRHDEEDHVLSTL